MFRCGHLLFTWKTLCGLKFHFGQFDRSETCTEVSFTPPEVMWTLIMKLPHTKVKFYPEVKSQTGLSSLRVSCKRDLIYFRGFYINFGTFWSFFKHFKAICLPESSLWLFLNFLKKRISKAVVVNLSFWQNLGYTQKKLQFWNISRKKICAGIT